MDSQSPFGSTSDDDLAMKIELARQNHLPTVSKQDLKQTTAVIETLVETPQQLHRLLQLIYLGIAPEMAEDTAPDGSAELT